MRSPRERHLLRSLAVAAALTLAITACGNGDGEPADDSEIEEPADDAEAGEPADDDGSDDLSEAADFYDGEQFTFIVSFGEGGGYDQIARAMAPYLEEELGADVLIENRDGAGGLVAANSLYTGDDSGLEAGFFSGQGIAGAVVGEAEGATFDLSEFSYIARAAEDPRVFTVGEPSGFQTIEDVIADDNFQFGSSGPGGSDHIDANVLRDALGINMDIITGYAGSAETELAATSGQTEGAAGTFGSRASAINAGDHIAVLAIAEERIEEIPDVPTILEMDLDEDGQALAEAHLAFQAMGRMVLAPPGLPEDRLAFLRQAFRNVIESEDFLAEMEQMDQPITYLSGEELAEVAEDVLDAPDVYVQLMQEAYGGGS
jgi:tripartite-type tricarboxylate transporter receptor subunit TctC